MDKQKIETSLKEIALSRSTPFCYNDYIKCPTGRCPQCGSDDLMRITEDDGPEYGTEWIIKAVLSAELDAVDLEVAFEELIRESHPDDVKVGWMSFDPVAIMKEMDPVGWRCALAEWESEEESEENILSFDGGSTYYHHHDLENFIEEALKAPAA